MTEKVFNKVACFTDMHLGNRANSPIFNKDCLDYTDWFIDQAREFGAETCIFLGDFFHNRATINVASMNVGIEIIERVARSFSTFFFLVGNHDMYYRDRRDVNSIKIAKNLSNVILVDAPLTVGDTTFLPWLIGDEWKTVRRKQTRYVFAHLELPTFYMNAMVQMPDHGGLRAEDMDAAEYVFTGHFHRRQARSNVIYIGSCFPHNFTDVNDDERGCMLLEHGGEPQFIDWSEAPKYRSLRLSEILDDPAAKIGPKTYAKVSVDVDVSYEEMSLLKEGFIAMGAREVEMRPLVKEDGADEFVSDIHFQSIDQIVENGLLSVQSATIDNEMLVDMYRDL